MTKREAFTDFDERTILESLRPELTKPETLRFSLEEIEATQASIPTIPNENSISDIQTEPTERDLPQTSVASGVPQEDRTTASERMGMKQRKSRIGDIPPEIPASPENRESQTRLRELQCARQVG